MKKNLLYFSLIVGISTLFTGCIWLMPFNFGGGGGEPIEPTSQYEPIYMSREELNQSVKQVAPQELKDPGKIYRYGQYILVNEKYKGVHIINNITPSNPIKIGFIEVPGCLDMAVKQNILYVDNAVDLVSINISNPSSIQVVNRLEKALPVLLPPDRWSFYDPNKGIVIGWKRK